MDVEHYDVAIMSFSAWDGENGFKGKKCVT